MMSIMRWVDQMCRLVMGRIGPVRRVGAVKLMVLFLAGDRRDANDWHVAGIAAWQHVVCTRCQPFGRTGTAGSRCLALVRFAVAESLCKRIASDFELSDSMILVRSHCCKPSLRKWKSFKIFCSRIWTRTWWRWCHNHMTSWLVPMHGIQNDLQK